MGDLIERLRTFADIEDSGGGACDLQFETSPSREAANEIERLRTRLEKAEAERDQLAFQLKGTARAALTIRNDALEEAAKVAENWRSSEYSGEILTFCFDQVCKTIRALKDKETANDN